MFSLALGLVLITAGFFYLRTVNGYAAHPATILRHGVARQRATDATQERLLRVGIRTSHIDTGLAVAALAAAVITAAAWGGLVPGLIVTAVGIFTAAPIVAVQVRARRALREVVLGDRASVADPLYVPSEWQRH